MGQKRCQWGKVSKVHISMTNMKYSPFQAWRRWVGRRWSRTWCCPCSSWCPSWPSWCSIPSTGCPPGSQSRASSSSWVSSLVEFCMQVNIDTGGIGEQNKIHYYIYDRSWLWRIVKISTFYSRIVFLHLASSDHFGVCLLTPQQSILRQHRPCPHVCRGGNYPQLYTHWIPPHSGSIHEKDYFTR